MCRIVPVASVPYSTDMDNNTTDDYTNFNGCDRRIQITNFEIFLLPLQVNGIAKPAYRYLFNCTCKVRY